MNSSLSQKEYQFIITVQTILIIESSETKNETPDQFLNSRLRMAELIHQAFSIAHKIPKIMSARDAAYDFIGFFKNDLMPKYAERPYWFES